MRMSRTRHVRKRNAMLAVSVAAVAAGVIIVASSSGGGSHHNDARLEAKARTTATSPSETAVVAGYLGVSKVQLDRELASGRTLAQIADATSGRSAKGLIDALVAKRAVRIRTAAAANKTSRARVARKLARLRRRISAAVHRTPGYRGLATIAHYLGMSTTTLRNELLAGASLRHIAEATPGRSVAGLIKARVKAERAELKPLLASGRISGSTVTRLLSRLREQVTREVDRQPTR